MMQGNWRCRMDVERNGKWWRLDINVVNGRQKVELRLKTCLRCFCRLMDDSWKIKSSVSLLDREKGVWIYLQEKYSSGLHADVVINDNVE